MAASGKTIIMNPSSERLVGILDDTGSKDLVVLCHGMRGSKDVDLLVNIASIFMQSGLSVFRFDFSGNGESQGDSWFRSCSKEVEDLRSVVLYWMKQGRVVRATVGHSKGGSTVVLYASKYHDVHTVINASGLIYLNETLKERILGEDCIEKIEKEGFLEYKSPISGDTIFSVTKDSLMEQLSIDFKKAASTIPNDCRVLTVAGSEDPVVAGKNVLDWDKVIPNHTLRIIDGADHMYSQHEQEFISVMIEFVVQDSNKDSN